MKKVFKDLCDSITVYRQIVLLLFLTRNDVDSLIEYRYLKNDIDRLCL